MGFIFSIIAAILYGIEPTLVDIILEKGLSSLEEGFIVSFFFALWALVFCLVSHKSLKLQKKQFIPVLLCGIFFLLTNIFLNKAYLLLPVGFATMTHFTYPIMVFLICVFLYKEKATPFKIASLLTCLSGLYCIFGTTSSYSTSGIIYALFSAFCYTLYLIISDKSSINALPSDVFTFYVGITGGIIGSGMNIGYALSSVSIYIQSLPLLIIISLMLFAAGYLLNRSIKLIGANKASSFTVVEPLTSVIVSSLLFHYDLSFMSLIGIGLVLLSLFLSNRQ